jgi:hypothetical protein
LLAAVAVVLNLHLAAAVLVVFVVLLAQQVVVEV